MTSWVTTPASNASICKRHKITHAMMRTSRCPDDDNRTPNRHPYSSMPTASPPRRRSPAPASSLVSLTVVVVVVAVVGLPGPVQAGMMDFSAPEVIQYGTCAQPKDQQPFDFRQFNGLWYQVEMVPNSYMEPKTCITLHFDWDGKAYNVTTKGLNEYNEEVQQDAVITKEQPQDPATSRPYLKIRASGVPPVPYHVVKTDYRSFACVYSCFELFSLMFEAFSVLSRNPEVDDATLNACHRAFRALNLDLTRLQPVHQGGLCLMERLEGSGEEPPRWDEEDEEYENALVALTSEEVNPSGDRNAASDRRLDLTVEETVLMEELEEAAREDEEEEAQESDQDAGEAQEEETDGGESGGSKNFSFTETKLESSSNCTAGETQEDSDTTSEKSGLEGKDSHRRKPKKSRRRKKTKVKLRVGKEGGKEEDKSTSTKPREQQLHMDEFHSDSMYDPEAEREVRRGDGREEAVTSAYDHLLPHSSAGGVEAPTLMLVLGLLTLVLRTRVPPTL